MIRRIGWLAATLWLALWAAPDLSLAQLEDNILGMTDEDLEGYLGPLNTGLSGTMNSAIFRTGYVPEMQFDFSIGVAAMAIGFGEDDRVYTPTDPPGFTSLERTEVPTVVGDPNRVIVTGEGNLSRIYPGGFDMGGFEIAVPQLTIGAVQGTRAVVRYIAIDLGDADIGEFSYFGIGGQHSITQWIPSLPVDLAAGFFVQNFKLGDDIVKANALHLNLTASSQFGGFLQPYFGLGYDSMGLKIDVEDEDDPEFSVDVDLDKETNVHVTLGVLAKLSVVSAFFEFNTAAASGFALGLDFGTIGGASHAQDHSM